MSNIVFRVITLLNLEREFGYLIFSMKKPQWKLLA
jgi:hypothetical protein